MFIRAEAVLTTIALVVSAASVCAGPASLTYDGRSFGAFVDVDPVPATFASDTGDLPSIGGTLQTTATDVLLDNVLNAEFMSTRVYSNATGVNSFAQTITLSVLPGTPAALTASTVSSTAIALCGGTVGSVSATHLVFGGNPIQLTGTNQTVAIPGVATLIINERIETITPFSSDVTINALHLVLEGGGEVIVSSSHAAVGDCAVVGAHPMPWSNLKALYR